MMKSFKPVKVMGENGKRKLLITDLTSKNSAPVARMWLLINLEVGPSTVETSTYL